MVLIAKLDLKQTILGPTSRRVYSVTHTPITPEDEQLRTTLGYRPPQNYKNTPWPKYKATTNGQFYNHAPAPTIMKCMPIEVWRDYTKIAIFRNPFDAMISRYYWEGGERTGVDYGEFVRNNVGMLMENVNIAPLSGEAKQGPSRMYRQRVLRNSIIQSPAAKYLYFA